MFLYKYTIYVYFLYIKFETLELKGIFKIQTLDSTIYIQNFDGPLYYKFIPRYLTLWFPLRADLILY